MNFGLISVKLLKPHPQNQHYYDDLSDEKYQEIKESIRLQGIRDPIKVLPDYTIICGHQRLRIALDLKIEKVPVIVMDISPEEAEYLLIADNEERRQNDNDPMKKARRAKFLKDYWNINHGGDRKSSEQIAHLKTLNDISEAINEDKYTTRRLLKLNDLIPELQEMVSKGTLKQTVAGVFASLSPEDQKNILDTFGESIDNVGLTQAQNLRKDLELSRTRCGNLQNQLDKLKKEMKKGHDTVVKLLQEKEKLEKKLEEKTVIIPEASENKEAAELQEKLNLIKVEIERLETVRQNKEFDLRDIELDIERAKSRQTKEAAVLGTLHKKFEHLYQAKGEIEYALKALDDDPYGNVRSKLRKMTVLFGDLNLLFTAHAERLEKMQQQKIEEQQKKVVNLQERRS